MLNYGRHWVDEHDISAVIDTMLSDYLTQGPKVPAFEEAFAEYVGAKHAIAVSSGTAALHLACIASGMQQGDLVITTPLTFTATANAIRMTGAEPYFVDVGDDLNISNQSGPYIVPVDFAGWPCDMASFKGLCIEDACHALGATYGGRPVGANAALTCFSLHPVKAITSAEGGMITTNNDGYAEHMRCLRNHGRVNGDTEILGFNYRMSDIHASMGLSQLKKLPQFIERRREIADKYCHAFGMKFHENHAYHLFVIEVDNRDDVKLKLADMGINCQIHYKPLHLHPFYGGKRGDFPVAESYYDRCLSLPIYPKMSNQDVLHVIESVKRCL